MDLNDAIRELVKKTVEEMGLSGSSPPVELITIEETCARSAETAISP
jgi:hypothetical protein